MELSTLIEHAIEQKASDIHLASGESPRLRVNGDLVRLDAPPIGRDDFNALLSPEAWLRIEAGQSAERTIFHGDFGLAALVFPCREDGLAATLRILVNQVPTLEILGLAGNPLFDRLLTIRRGLVLVTGPTGSGKTTATCALIEEINATRPARIFVVHGSPTYRFTSKEGFVTEIHARQDYQSYERGLAVLQNADMDVLTVDDIPTLDSLRTLLLYAERGHLVIANLHADSVVDAFERLIQAAGAEEHALRQSLARNLVALSAQRLVRRSDMAGRGAVIEWVMATPAVREVILSGVPARLADLQRTDPDCRSVETAVNELVSAGQISEETAAEILAGVAPR